jgi:endonuclease I
MPKIKSMPKRKNIFKYIFPFLVFIILMPLLSHNAERKNRNKINAIPAGYYDTAAGKSGVALNNALHNIIKGHIKFPYTSTSTDVWDILMDTDEDTANTSNVILIYTGRSQEKNLNSSQGNDADYWNREHVWSKSHGFPNEADTAYTDVHHLRPCDSSVNSSRSNKDFDNGGTPHPEAIGNFSDADSWEPRDAVKGDVARMMFYMEVRYENDGDYDLELQETIPTSGPNFARLSALLAWHQQDPVDNWEHIRNDKIYGYQGNRNPFIDHPEYVDLIWGAAGVKGEPSNHPTNFNASAAGTNISLNWTDATGDTLPDNYLIKVSEVSYAAISNPVDSISVADDADLSDGSGAANVSFGSQAYTFTGLDPTTIYYFKIFSSTNSSANLNYKTDGTIATASATTEAPGSTTSDLFISEYVEGSTGTNKYLEIYNGTGASVDLANYSVQIYYNGNTSAGATIALSGSILHDDVFVIANSSSDLWSGTPDLLSGSLSFNGNDAVVLRENGSNLDIIGQIGDASNLYNDRTLRRVASINGPSATYNASEWDDLAESYVDLGQHTFDTALPVELVLFAVNYTDGSVELRWKTASELDNLGFIIERSEADEPFYEIASWRDDPALKGAGNYSREKSYAYINWDVAQDMHYSYRLWDESYAGIKTLISEISINTSQEIEIVRGVNIPEKTQLMSNYPNPFNPSTNIPFKLAKSTKVRISIHDIQGRLVKKLFSALLAEGSYELAWGGRNTFQQTVSSGIYIYTLVTPEFNQSKRMLLLR